MLLLAQVPLRLHPALLALVRGDSLDPATYLPSPGSHLVGCRGASVASLFTCLPALDAIAAATGGGGGGGEAGAHPAAGDAKLGAFLGQPQPFSAGLGLGAYLETLALPWWDPVTETPLPPPPGGHGESGEGGESGNRSSGGEGGVWWGGEVSGRTLRAYLHALADLWLGRGVARQVAALKAGLNDIVEVRVQAQKAVHETRERYSCLQACGSG